MLALLYLILAWFVGYIVLKTFLPSVFELSKGKSLGGKSLILPNWMVVLPASFLTGTLFLTWFTYLIAWLTARFLPSFEKPLLLGDLATFVVFTAITAGFIFRNPESYARWIRLIKTLDWNKTKEFIRNNALELIYVLVILIVWNVFMFRSLFVKDGVLNIGISVFSDFGATLPLVRSFSLGSNFPTEYPHFGSGSLTTNDIRYHFLFQFLSGNLEFLGLRIDWAFNLPSILSMVSFLMLLYSFVVILMGKRIVALLASALFTFRSSFAFFTFVSDLKQSGINSFGGIVHAITTKIDPHIGKTEHEDWGFWAQKVFVNKRHFAYTLGLTFFVFILLIPLYKKMVEKLQYVKSTAFKNSDLGFVQKMQLYLRLWGKEFAFTADAWLPEKIWRPILAGLFLGLLGFFNGAVVIAALPVLFIIAILSKHRLEFLITALITTVLVLGESRFFTEGSPFSPELYIGFLAAQKNLFGIFRYYIELLGLLPILLLVSLFFGPKGSRWLTLAFLSPIVLATTTKFSVDVGANHVIIIFGVILLNIIAANFLSRLFTTNSLALTAAVVVLLECVFIASANRMGFSSFVNPSIYIVSTIIIVCSAVDIFLGIFKKTGISINRNLLSMISTVGLLLVLTLTGIVDMYTLYNDDKRAGTIYQQEDMLIHWASTETKPNEIFLISPTFTHPILMAGRKVYLGGAYFTWTAGYDMGPREAAVKNIYGAENEQTLRNSLAGQNIDYIVIDNGTRTSQDYVLHEDVIANCYERVYNDPSSGVSIYKVD